jgi:hypothetical protein
MLQQLNNLVQGKDNKPLHKFTLPDGKIYKSTFRYIFLDKNNEVIGRSNSQAIRCHIDAVIRLEMVSDFEGRTSVVSPSKFIQRTLKFQ